MEDLTGQKFGRLTVIKLHHKEQKYNANGIKDGFIYYYLCKCDCGNKKIIRKNDLRFNKIKSCGCLKSELSAKRKVTHGLTKTRIYSLYRNILNRCYNKNVKCYVNYGARGIKVCQNWLDDFMNFYNWAIKNGYADNLTIDRIDVNGNYEPNNCQWITLFEQASNRRNNHNLTYKNVTHTIADWSRITQIKEATIRQRINLYGWSVEKALTKKVNNVKQ